MFIIKLKELRIKNKLTQKELAKRLNITQTALSRLENGTTTAHEDIIVKVADIFDVSTDYLLGRTEIKNVYHFIRP